MCTNHHLVEVVFGEIRSVCLGARLVPRGDFKNEIQFKCGRVATSNDFKLKEI